MMIAEPAARYEVVANSMAFDHEMFNHGDVVDEQQLGGRVYQLLRAGLIKRMPKSAGPPSQGASSKLPDAD